MDLGRPIGIGDFDSRAHVGGAVVWRGRTRVSGRSRRKTCDSGQLAVKLRSRQGENDGPARQVRNMRAKSKGRTKTRRKQDDGRCV